MIETLKGFKLRIEEPLFEMEGDRQIIKDFETEILIIAPQVVEESFFVA